MKIRLLLALLAAAASSMALAEQPSAVETLPPPAPSAGAYGGEMMAGPWHSGYYYTAWGRPVPLVVPPTAMYQTNYGWGIGNTRITPIYPQFGGPYYGYFYEGYETWRPTPYWPSDTIQFGVYYVRGPW